MNNYKQIRNEIYEKLEDNSMMIIYSGALKQYSADENYPFEVNTNFYYLTGLDQDNMYLCVTKCKGKVHETIFAYENTEFHSKWMGDWLTPEQIIETSAIEAIRYVDTFNAWLKDELLKNVYIKKVYLDLEKPGFDGQVNFGYVLKDKINSLAFDKKIIDVYPLITKARGVKKDYEVATFQKAVDITKLALEEVMKSLKTFDYEYQVQGKFEYEIKRIGNCGVSFETIAAAGKNAATLHYRANDDTIKDKNMILLDLGARYNKYHADISRTYPINGKYGEKELVIYKIVLACNKYIISQIKPGVSIKELQQMTIDFLADGCLNAGLISTKEEISNYYFHGVSHHIGLDTHDPYPRYVGVLEPGMIISCEPGLYFKNLGIGVRIEDDILVTSEGNVNLSKDIIKEPEEIEAFIAANSK